MSRTAPLIKLSDEEHQTLLSWTRSEKTQQRYVLRARIVLAVETVSGRVLNHLIVSAHDSFSFRKAGQL